MVRGQKQAVKTAPKELLSASEVANLQEQKQEAQSALREIEQGAGAGTRGAMDPSILKVEINRIDKILADRSPVDVRGKQKDELVKREKDLEDLIADGMPTQYEMRQPTKNPGAVKKHMAWCRRTQLWVEEYVRIQKILRPEEPKSIEVLRKEK